MSCSLDSLAPELRELIFAYCRPEELANVACCSKEYRDCVQPLLWQCLNIHNDQLKNTEPVILTSKIKHLKLTKKLTFFKRLEVIKGTGCFQSSSFIYASEKSRTGDNFRQIVSCCDPDQLSSLGFKDFMIENALSYAAGRLTNLREMELCNIENICNQWLDIKKFVALVKLTISDCLIHNYYLKSLCRLLHLKELLIEDCPQLTIDCIAPISNIIQLRKLRLTVQVLYKENDYYLPHYPPPMDKLVDLRFLDLSYTYVEEEFFSPKSLMLKQIHTLDVSFSFLTDAGLENICNVMVSLHTLVLCGMVSMTDDGLVHLCKRKMSLKNLKLNVNSWLSDVGLMHVAKLRGLEVLHLNVCSEISNIGVEYLSSSLPVIKHLWMYNCSRLTTKCLEKFPPSCYILFNHF